MNAGAAKLAAVELSISEIIERLKAEGVSVTGPAVSRWQHGKRVPRGEDRRALSRAFGIPTGAWDEEPEAPGAPAAAASSPRPIASADPTAADLARDLLTRIQLYREQAETTQLGVQARKMLAEMEGSAIERYARLSGNRSSERDMVASPQFKRLLEEMFRALAPYPDAMRALRAAMTAAEAAA